MPSIPACDSDANASAKVTSGASVSVQLHPSHLKHWLIASVIEQTAHNLRVSTSLSALEIIDLPPVSVPATGVTLNNHLIYAIV